MKNLLISTLLLISINAFAQKTIYETPQNTKLSKLFLNKGELLIQKIWEIDEIKGEDKIIITFSAIQAYNYIKPNEVIKGMKIIIENTTQSTTSLDQFPFWELTTYIDFEEYSQLMISLDNFLKFYSQAKDEEFEYDAKYETKDHLELGIKKIDGKEVLYAGIIFEETMIEVILGNPEKEIPAIKEIFDNAYNDIYLLNKKDKKGKKGTDSEEIIDTDI